MRYADSSTPGGRGRGSPVVERETARPAERTVASRPSRPSRPGCGACRALGDGASSERRTPSTLRSSARASRAFSRIPVRFSRSSSVGCSTRCGATWAWMEITDMWWATTSCSSRAIRPRSSSRARRACSSAVSSTWTTRSLRARRRLRSAVPRASAVTSTSTATAGLTCGSGGVRRATNSAGASEIASAAAARRGRTRNASRNRAPPCSAAPAKGVGYAATGPGYVGWTEGTEATVTSAAMNASAVAAHQAPTGRIIPATSATDCATATSSARPLIAAPNGVSSKVRITRTPIAVITSSTRNTGRHTGAFGSSIRGTRSAGAAHNSSYRARGARRTAAHSRTALDDVTAPTAPSAPLLLRLGTTRVSLPLGGGLPYDEGAPAGAPPALLVTPERGPAHQQGQREHR